MDEVMKDERFSHIFNDPSFRRIPKKVRKTEVDNRFKKLLKNKKFKEKCKVDEHGCALNLDSSENFTKLYNMDEESSESEKSEEKEIHKTEKSNKASKKERVKKKKQMEKEKGPLKGHFQKHRKEDIDSEQESNSSEDESEEKEIHKTEKSTKVSKKERVKKKKQLEKEKGPLKGHFQEHRKKDIDSEQESPSEDESEEKEIHKTEKVSKKERVKKKKQMKKEKGSLKGHFQEHRREDIDSEQESSSEDESEKEIHKTEKSTKVSKKERGKKKKLVEKKKGPLKDELEEHKKEETDSEQESSSEDESDNEKLDAFENADSSDDEDTDDDSESDESESNDDTFDHQWEEQHERAPDTDEITKRLAVCHMDWDRIRAVDLYACFNSFKPPDASIISVKIYPSEYGLERMEEEKLKGPRELVEKTLAPDEEEDLEDKKGSKYHREKLRQYQMNRLKYYYAIVECDTPETANILYEQLNGMEYESSSVRFDLRFVPDDTTFDHEPTSIAENPDLNEYKPKLFVTTALQQVKVGLTWDETDPQRREILQKAFTEPDDIEKDIREYLASSSGESEEDNVDNKEEGNPKLKERIAKYKALLDSINEQEKEKSGEKYEMEITWEAGAKEETEDLVKEKLEEEKSYTPFEELKKKKKEKQKLKKKEKKSKISDELGSSDDEFDSEMSDSDVVCSEMKVTNTKKKNSKSNDELYLISDAKKVEADHEEKRKWKKKKKKDNKEIADDFQVDVNDPRFSAIYTSPAFNIDPSDPHFKSTPGNLAIIAEKQRRLKNKNGPTIAETKSNKKMKYR